MRFTSLFTILVRKEHLVKINNRPKHHAAGPTEARGPIQRIGCIGLMPALSIRVRVFWV